MLFFYITFLNTAISSQSDRVNRAIERNPMEQTIEEFKRFEDKKGKKYPFEPNMINLLTFPLDPVSPSLAQAKLLKVANSFNFNTFCSVIKLGADLKITYPKEPGDDFLGIYTDYLFKNRSDYAYTTFLMMLAANRKIIHDKVAKFKKILDWLIKNNLSDILLHYDSKKRTALHWAILKKTIN